MTGLVIAAGVLLLGVLGLQLLFANSFVRLYQQTPPEHFPDAEVPSVLLVLCLRGADPFLERALESLFTVEYPALDIRVVVDSSQDPAYEIAQTAAEQFGNGRVTVKLLKQPRLTCGLRVSGLIQEFTDIDSKYEVAAWVDADVIPYERWLQDVVAPFQDPKVGATTGIRWYLPNPGGWGTMVRSIWNIGGIVQMVFFKIAFGGTLAIRASILRETDILERWSKLLWEDTYTETAVRGYGYDLAFVPEATMANQETISLRSCYRFMCRQMLNARLYHRSWRFLLMFGVISSVIPYLSAGLGIYLLTEREWLKGGVLLGLVAIQVTGVVLTYAWSGSYANRVARRRHVPNWRFHWTVGLAVPLTAMVYSASLLRILLSRNIEWRGIEYEVLGPWDIRLKEYRPYIPPTSETQEGQMSL